MQLDLLDQIRQVLLHPRIRSKSRATIKVVEEMIVRMGRDQKRLWREPETGPGLVPRLLVSCRFFSTIASL